MKWHVQLLARFPQIGSPPSVQRTESDMLLVMVFAQVVPGASRPLLLCPTMGYLQDKTPPPLYWN